MTDLKNDPIGSKIIGAFNASQNSFRTIGGIARDTGLSFGTVNDFINKHYNMFKQAPLTPSGTNLYQLNKDHFLKIKSNT